MLDDLVNSVIRYFSNNFCDGYFEDCLNVAFNKVQMGPNTDHRVKSLWSNTFVMFFLLAILPALFVIYAVSHFANPKCFYVTDFSLTLSYLLLVGYIFGRKGTFLGGLFVSRV